MVHSQRVKTEYRYRPQATMPCTGTKGTFCASHCALSPAVTITESSPRHESRPYVTRCAVRNDVAASRHGGSAARCEDDARRCMTPKVIALESSPCLVDIIDRHFQASRGPSKLSLLLPDRNKVMIQPGQSKSNQIPHPSYTYLVGMYIHT